MTHPLMMNCEHNGDAVCVTCAAKYARIYERKIEILERALEEIAGIEEGMGIHRMCCSKGKRKAEEALELARGVIDEQ